VVLTGFARALGRGRYFFLMLQTVVNTNKTVRIFFSLRALYPSICFCLWLHKY